MNSKIISINRNINDDPADYEYLFSMCNQLRAIKNTVIVFDFTGCGFLRQNAVVVLGSVIRLLQKNDNEVRFELSTISDSVRSNLLQKGFLHHLGLVETGWNESGTSIPYREDIEIDDDSFTEYLSEKWLGRGWVDVSSDLRDHIVTCVIEAYVNVFDHAKSPTGIITCGQFYPDKNGTRGYKELRITMVDMGVGIPQTVREYLKQPSMTAEKALEWAFEPGKTTKDHNNFARGNGLKLLKSFMEDNHGKLEIYSETGYVCIDDQGTHFESRLSNFQGTIVQITLICDAARYTLPQEDDQNSDEWFT